MPATAINQKHMWRFVLGPDWRWLSAIGVSGARDPEIDQSEDDHIRRAAVYVSLLEHSPSKARRQYPLLAQARAMWNHADMRERLTIMTLADFDRTEMATRFNVTPEVIETVELFFLDVRSCLTASDWVHAQVIHPEKQAGHYERAVRYRLAYGGGPAVAARLLDLGQGARQDSLLSTADQEFLLQIKLLAALEMPLTTAKESVQRQRILLDHQHRSARLALEREKFRTRAELEARRLALAEEQMKVRTEKQKEKSRLRDERQARVSLRRQWQEAEQRNRIRRAEQSPLAKLVWRTPAADVPLVQRDQDAPRQDGAAAERQGAAA